MTELPPIEAHITEFQCPEVVCPACGKTTQAPVPDEVKRQCGAQLTALIAYLTVVCRLPRRVVQRLLEGALHIPISLGSTHAWALTRRLFRLGHRFQGVPRCRGGPRTRAQLVAKVLPLQRQLFRLAEGALDRPDDDVRNLATALFTQHENFFVFVHHDGVEPTNNRAERALRPAVQWRKIMFGTRSAAGELAVARLLTVMSTCQMQQLNVLAYLTAAIQCHRRRQEVPSLLPKRP